jgi:hypothetical protein
MTKNRLCILVSLLLAIALCGGVVAGPKHPTYGDPDIVEGIRSKDEPSQTEFCSSPETLMVVDIPLLGRVFINWQEQRDQLRKMAERPPAALKKDRSRY